MPIDSETLIGLPLFSGLDSGELEELAAQLVTQEAAPGQVIIAEGSPPDHPMFVLLHGEVEVLKRGPDGRAHVISSLTAPSVFGEIEVIARRPAIATVTAVTAVKMAALLRGTFDEMRTRQRPCILKVVHNLAQVLAHRLAATDERLAAHFDLAAAGQQTRLGELRQVLYSSWHKLSNG